MCLNVLNNLKVFISFKDISHSGRGRNSFPESRQNRKLSRDWLSEKMNISYKEIIYFNYFEYNLNDLILY